MAALYVAMTLAERVDATNQALVELKRRIDDPAQRRSAIGQAIETISRTIHYGGLPV